ncbi:hypothetical protein D9M71_385020 [compost metagenome]
MPVTFLGQVVEAVVHAAAQAQAHIFGNDDRIGLDDALVAVETDHGGADQVLGAQVGIAHAPGAFDERGERSFEPGDFDDAIGMEQVGQLVPLRQVAVDPAGDQVGDLQTVFLVTVHRYLPWWWFLSGASSVRVLNSNRLM